MFSLGALVRALIADGDAPSPTTTEIGDEVKLGDRVYRFGVSTFRGFQIWNCVFMTRRPTHTAGPWITGPAHEGFEPPPGRPRSAAG